MTNTANATDAQALSAICSTELKALLWFAHVFLWLAVIAAAVVTLVTVVAHIVALVRKAPLRADGEEGGGAGALIDSIKGLVTALAQAPAWFAIFLAAILLLWIAPTYFGSKCLLQTGIMPVIDTGPDNQAIADNATG